jgi:hypothetical protein
MGNIEADHVSHPDVVAVPDLKEGMLIHHLDQLPAGGRNGRGLVTRPVMQDGCGQSRIECGIALAHGDNGFPALGHRLHIGPKLESRQQAPAHLMGDWVAPLDQPLGLAIDAGIVRQIAPGT